MTSTSNLDIKELKRLHAAATPGEWTIEVEQYGGSGAVTVHGLNRLLHDTEWADPQDFEQDQANAESFAALHNAFPALIARLEAAEAALKAVDGLATCAEVDMSGKVRYRFMTTGQNEVIHQVKAALHAPLEAAR